MPRLELDMLVLDWHRNPRRPLIQVVHAVRRSLTACVLNHRLGTGALDWASWLPLAAAEAVPEIRFCCFCL